MKNPSPSAPCCAICTETDRRALVDVKLDAGPLLVLCGTHAVMMRRLTPGAVDLADLRLRLRERRDTSERRLDEDAGDALAMALHTAFAGERRRGDDRRALAPHRHGASAHAPRCRATPYGSGHELKR